MSDLQKIDDSGKLDLNFAVGGEERHEGYVQIDLNMQAQQGSSPVHSDFRYQNPVSSYCKSHYVATQLDQGDTRKTKISYDQERTQSPFDDYDQERTQSPFDDYDQDRTKSPYQGEMDALPGSYFHKSSEFKTQTFHRERGTEDSANLQELPLTEDNNQIEETEGISYIDRPNTSPRDKKVKDTLLQKSRYEFNKSSNYEIVEGEGIEEQEGKFSSYSGPHSVDCAVEQKNEKCNSSGNSPAESRKLDMQHSTPHSIGRSHRKSASPGAVKLMFVSPQGSPQVHLSPEGHKPRSLQECVQELLHSPSPCREKYSSSPKRSDLAKRIPPNDHLSLSATRTKLSPKRFQQGSHHKDGSSLKRLSASPEPHYSPKRHGRSNRPRSRSPIRRRDPVSRYGRDYLDRSHSRSAYTRDHYRSPRRRSPGYHSHRSSPRRKPWSPPPNRRTGLGKPGNNLFVAGFNFLTTERDLERKFSRFGRVRDVRIVRHNRSGDSRGFGFLSLESDEDADAAIRALDETEWNGRIILVEKSKSTR